MPKIVISSVKNGVKTVVSDTAISKEKADRFKETLAKMQAEKKERMQKRFDEIPEIHWEILKYANNHTKEQVLSEYPEYADYINRIRFHTT